MRYMADRALGPSYFAIITGPVLDNQELADSAKILYGRVTSLADREGYCWASNRYLAEISRCGERTITRLLTQLEDLGFIETEVLPSDKKGGRERRIYIGNRAAQCVDKIGYTSQFCREGIAKNGETLNKIDKDSLYIPPKSPRKKRKEPREVPDWKPERFERFWKFYPKEGRKDKQEAMDAWDELRPSDELLAEIAAGLTRLMKTDLWKAGKGIPYVCRFLRKRRWEDAESLEDEPAGHSQQARVVEEEGVTYI